jgi:hypothetical protein
MTTIFPKIPTQCEAFQIVNENRFNAESTYNQLALVMKVTGNMGTPFTIPDYYAQANYKDSGAYDHQGVDFQARLKATCGDRPGGIRPNAKRNWDNCNSNLHAKYALEYACTQASIKEKTWLENQLKSIRNQVDAKAIAETEPVNVLENTDVATLPGTTQSNNTAMIIIAFVLLIAVGFALYYAFKK